jgi:hypothetical protein
MNPLPPLAERVDEFGRAIRSPADRDYTCSYQGGVFMASGKDDLIRLLEAELDFIQGGGYGRRAGQPGGDPPVFYHSLVCINHWLVPDHESECHDDCILMDAVPESFKKAGLPCHFIPLNDAGDTVKSLAETGDRERLEETVKHWLRATIKRLREEGAREAPDVKY